MSEALRLPFAKGSETSRQAALSKVMQAPTELRRVYEWALTKTEGFIDEDGPLEIPNMNGDTFRPRRVWLEEHGLIMATARTRKTSKGRNATVRTARVPR